MDVLYEMMINLLMSIFYLFIINYFIDSYYNYCY